jgi:hypothetical protein
MFVSVGVTLSTTALAGLTVSASPSPEPPTRPRRRQRNKATATATAASYHHEFSGRKNPFTTQNIHQRQPPLQIWLVGLQSCNLATLILTSNLTCFVALKKFGSSIN